LRAGCRGIRALVIARSVAPKQSSAENRLGVSPPALVIASRLSSLVREVVIASRASGVAIQRETRPGVSPLAAVIASRLSRHPGTRHCEKRSAEAIQRRKPPWGQPPRSRHCEPLKGRSEGTAFGREGADFTGAKTSTGRSNPVPRPPLGSAPSRPSLRAGIKKPSGRCRRARFDGWTGSDPVTPVFPAISALGTREGYPYFVTVSLLIVTAPVAARVPLLDAPSNR
jgi:hypothetical protein